MLVWQINNLYILGKVNVNTKNIRVSVKSHNYIPNTGLRAIELKSEHLIKIKISVDVPPQIYVNEECNINWRMNPFVKINSFFFCQWIIAWRLHLTWVNLLDSIGSSFYLPSLCRAKIKSNQHSDSRELLALRFITGETTGREEDRTCRKECWGMLTFE